MFTMPDGAVLPARRWMPEASPGRVMLALHGMNDSRDWMVMPAPALTAAGFAVYAPDQRGFGQAPGRGLWPGTGALAADANEMLRQLAARHPGIPLYLAGESMGGAVAMVAMTTPGGPPVVGTVLLSPAVWGRAQLGIVLSSGLWLAANLAPGTSVTGREVPIKVVASDNRDALLALGRDPLTIRRTRFDALRGLVDLMDAATGGRPAPARPDARAVWRPRHAGARGRDGAGLGSDAGRSPPRPVSARLPPADARPEPASAARRHCGLGREPRRMAALGRRLRRRLVGARCTTDLARPRNAAMTASRTRSSAG